MGLIIFPGFLGLISDFAFLPRTDRNVIFGYSMGGRIVLSLLEKRPFDKAVIVSAGLNAPDPARRARDAEWARRFETEEWSSLMRAWNAQEIFGGHVLERREEDYDRGDLAMELRDLSPAVLPPPKLESIETPVLWVAGERDTKYVDIARRAVARLPHAELWICPNAAHRVPWEQPDALVARMLDFI
ncbi:MAG TPA: alpha/beta fold hydrolase [Thermoanaerobaculia bacterium]|jgi:2-succinyl-6-hydroxy-2,4-cyclohexadiene-1-carboxylate synthase